MEIQNKLDEDFLFYLSFTSSFIDQLQDKGDVDRCNAWLEMLCGTECISVEQKRNRNIYLSNLVLCMQEGKLSCAFLKPPNEADLSDAMQVFGHVSPNVVPPDWLQQVVDGPDDDENDENSRDGRTYLATRTLPGGEGAFAYLAVTLASDEPRWLGGGEGMMDRAMEEKFPEYVPPISEMERILLRRKDPEEREKVLAFYEAIITNINSELEEDVQPENNETVNGLIDQLIEDLKSKLMYEPYGAMGEKQRRTELLLMLHDKVYARRQKIAQREEVLDDLEHKTLPASFFDVSVEAQDKIELPAAMWEQAINKVPNKRNMDSLFDNYPHLVIEKFLDLLSNEKEEIAMRMQRRHENIVAQMRKELRREGEKGRLKVEEAERAAKQAQPVLVAVKEAYKKQQDALRRTEEQKKAQISDQQQLYEQLRSALYETQRSVEEEAERGRLLTEQINSVNVQTDIYQQVNEDSIRKTEAANIAIMRNIKRLRHAVKQHELRITQIRAMASGHGGSSTGQFYFF